MTSTAVEGSVERRIGDRVVRLVRDDITEDVKLGSGHGSAIQQHGGVKIQEALDAAGRCPVGEAAGAAGRKQQKAW